MFAIILLMYAVRGRKFLPTDYVHSIAGQYDNVLTHPKLAVSSE